MGEVIIELQDIVFKRGQRVIMEDLSLNIRAGELTALMGPSGVGKTTLIKLITAQEKPHSGSVRVFGERLHRLPRKQLFALRQRIGVLFQSGALLGDLSVFDNVALPLRENTHLSERIINDLVLIKLEAVGLRAAVDLFPRQLSGGMARRVGLARAMVLDPEIILYDEPFAGQDPITMAMLIKLIDTLGKSLQLTSVAISHDVQEILSISDRGYLLYGGKAYGGISPKQLLQSSHQYTQQFLHGLADGSVPFHMPSNESLQRALLGEQ